MTAWIRTGTVAVVNGSPEVTGTATDWTSARVLAGWAMVLPNFQVAEILSVNEATQVITLASDYQGSSGSGQAYAIMPTTGAALTFAQEAKALADLVQGHLTGILAGRHADGEASLPAIRFASDEDTGLWRAAANVLAVATGGAERLRVTNAGAQITGQLTGSAVQASATDTTPGRLMRADFGYSRGNLLGNVSQSAGVPTGAVIERGENANGQYVRFADGTQLCISPDLAGIDVTTAAGAIFRSASPAVWTFPATFSAGVATVSGSVTSMGNSQTHWGSFRVADAGSAEITVFAWQAITLRTVRAMAAGRWF